MASIGFRWLDILEKEFDKAFVDLDLSIGELESDEPDVVFNVRQKLCTLSSCFAQLTHKSQTIFQNSAKIEAELIHMRTELVESKAKQELLDQELHNLLLQLHSQQLSQLPDNLANKKQLANFKDVNSIKKRLDAEIKQSPIHKLGNSIPGDLKFSPLIIEEASYKLENAQLHSENLALRNSVLSLNSEVYGAKLAAKYLDKELAGRIQQLQLLGREMRGDVRDKLWRQLESEILLQRRKTVVRACRRNVCSMLANDKACSKPSEPPESITEGTEHFGDIRTVVVKKKAGQGLGISITGGREHGVPILISELEPNGPAALSNQLYIGDAILFVNDLDLRQVCHREAVSILQQQNGDCILQVQYVAADDSDNSLEEDGYNFRFFDDEVCDQNNTNGNLKSQTEEIINTPTAPRTPEPASWPLHMNTQKIMTPQQNLLDIPTGLKNNYNQDIYNFNLNASNGNLDQVYKKETLKDDKVTDVLNSDNMYFNANRIREQFKMEKVDTSVSNDSFRREHVLKSMTGGLKLDNQKKIEENYVHDDFNCSTNSLNSENLSSPMQTSADVYIDSEVLSTDVTSNDSHSPKNLHTQQPTKKSAFTFQKTDVNRFSSLEKFLASNSFDSSSNSNFQRNYESPDRMEQFPKKKQYTVTASNESLSNPKSDQSLLNSGESCDSSPVHKNNRDYKKNRKQKKKYFGVKTLQSIFNKHDGYSDISSTCSEFGDEPVMVEQEKSIEETKSEPIKEEIETLDIASKPKVYRCVNSEITQQFDENLHNFLSDIFTKSSTSTNNADSNTVMTVSKATGTKKYFSINGQNLRVGKALRLCPNESFEDVTESEQRKEKLLARYVYNANSISADGVGDPDFGTPV